MTPAPTFYQPTTTAPSKGPPRSLANRKATPPQPVSHPDLAGPGGNQATEAKDWVFRANLHFDPNVPRVPQLLGPQEVNIGFYAYAPAKPTVTAGTTITSVNNDVVEHTALALGHSVARRFNPGECGCVRLLIRSATPARTIRG